MKQFFWSVTSRADKSGYIRPANRTNDTEFFHTDSDGDRNPMDQDEEKEHEKPRKLMAEDLTMSGIPVPEHLD